MHARAELVAEPDGRGGVRLPVLRSQVPLVLRPTPDAVYVAAAAAGPLDGDTLELTVTVKAGADLTVRWVAATVALTGRSTFSMALDVGEGATLRILPEVTVLTDGTDHHVRTTATVAGTGRLVLREEALLGRHGETGGRYRNTLRVTYDGRPALHHDVTLDGADPATTLGARAYGSLLHCGAIAGSSPAIAPQGDAATMELAHGGTLTTALAGDALTLRRRLEAAELVHLSRL